MGGSVLKRGAKTKRSKRMYFKVKDSYIIADLAILFLAFTMFSFAWFSVISHRHKIGKRKINSRKAEKEARKEDTLEKEELKKRVEALENEINMYRRESR